MSKHGIVSCAPSGQYLACATASYFLVWDLSDSKCVLQDQNEFKGAQLSGILQMKDNSEQTSSTEVPAAAAAAAADADASAVSAVSASSTRVHNQLIVKTPCATRCISWSQDGKFVLTGGDDKLVRAYSTSSWTKVAEVSFPKRIVAGLTFSNDDVLSFVGCDMSGDVYETKLIPGEPYTFSEPGNLLGHLAVVTAIASARDASGRQFLLTADLDQRIRVSHFPGAYNIESFCMGHSSFVSTVLNIPSGDNDAFFLVSGGGQNEIKIWNGLSGECLQTLVVGVEDGQEASSEAFVSCLQFDSPSGKLFVTISDTPVLYEFNWDLESRQLNQSGTRRLPSVPSGLTVAGEKIWALLHQEKNSFVQALSVGGSDSGETLEIVGNVKYEIPGESVSKMCSVRHIKGCERRDAAIAREAAQKEKRKKQKTSD